MTKNRGVEGSLAQQVTLDHVALVVTSVESSSSFYTTLLGLEELERVTLSDHTIQYLGTGTAAKVELIEYTDSASKMVGEADQRAIAMRHLAWNVTDVASLEEWTTQQGGVVIARPVFVPELGFTSMLIRDPDGIEVELIQRT